MNTGYCSRDTTVHLTRVFSFYSEALRRQQIITFLRATFVVLRLNIMKQSQSISQELFPIKRCLELFHKSQPSTNILTINCHPINHGSCWLLPPLINLRKCKHHLENLAQREIGCYLGFEVIKFIEMLFETETSHQIIYIKKIWAL